VPDAVTTTSHAASTRRNASFDMRGTAGPFVAAANVQTDKTVESLTEFFKELEGMKTPLSRPDLTRARNLEALSFPGAFETTSGVASNLAELAVYGLPESFFSEYVPKIQAVSVADVERAAKQYLQSDKFAVVVVGDLAKIEKGIRAANFAPRTRFSSYIDKGSHNLGKF